MTCHFERLLATIAAIDTVPHDSIAECDEPASYEVTIVRTDVKGFAVEVHAQVCAEHEMTTGMAEGLQSTRRIRVAQTT